MAKRKAADRPDLLEAAFAQIAEHGWAGWSPRALAESAGYSVEEVYEALPVPASLLRALSQRLDRAMLAMPADELAELGPRDRLFELLMRRFEAMSPFVPGLRRLTREAREPEFIVQGFCNLDRMAGWLLELGGLRYRGLQGRLARRALMLAYGRTFRVRLDDTSEDLAATMAELDKRLDQLERLAGFGNRFLGGLCRRRSTA